MAKAFAFDKDGHRRVAAATRTVEATAPEGRIKLGQSGSAGWGLVVCTLDAILNAGSFALATIRVFDGTDTWNAGTVKITVYDLTLDAGGSIASGSNIIAGPTGAAYVLVDAKCEDIS